MSASVLSSLEPLFGASLAINLAYLNLNQFRYRDSIAELAKEKLQHAPDNVQSTAWHKEIKSLADQKSNAPPKLKLPSVSAWSHIYRWLFHHQIDKYVSIVLTAISAAYLFLGVAHSVGMFPNAQSAFGQTEILNEIMYASVGLSWPMVMVLAAKFCTTRCTAFIKYQLDNITNSELSSGKKDLDAASAELDAQEKAKS